MNKPTFKELYYLYMQKLTNFPYIEQDFDALTNYELLCKVVEELNKMIQNINTQNESIIALYNAFTTLKDYVDNYFDNLDVQEEINNKLNEMAQDGTITQLIKGYVDPYIEQQNIRINNVENLVESLASGSPKGVYSTVSALESANPATGVYIVTSNGHIYSWTKNGTNAIDLGVYQATSISSNDPVITELDSRYNQYLNNYTIDNIDSFTTPFKVKTGQKVHLNITDIDGNFTIFTKNHTETVYKVVNTRIKTTFTATNDGEIVFYKTAGSLIKGECYIESKITNIVHKNQYLTKNDIPNATGLANIQLKSSNYILNNGNNNNLYSNMNRFDTNINNISDYAVSSSIAISSPVIRIKNNDGSNIYKNIVCENLATSNSASILIVFGEDGQFINMISGTHFINTYHSEFSEEWYYAIFIEYPNSDGYQNVKWKFDKVSIAWLESTPIYYVGPNRTYTKFMDCINAIGNNDKEKIIYVDAGVYDIFDEIGGSTFANSITSDQRWEDVSTFIPNNTKIIGNGNVVFNFLPETDEISEAGSSYLSLLNIRGNFEIENIKMFAKNCRYVIHDETSNHVEYENTIHKIKNCELHYITGRATGIGGTAYGCGFMQGMCYEFDNVIFDSKGKGYPISFHNGTTDGGTNILFNNCVFKANASWKPCLQLVANISSNQEIKTVLSNCYMDYKGIDIVPTNQYIVTTNPYQIYINNSNSICGNIIVHTTENFTNTKIPEIYNIIS